MSEPEGTPDRLREECEAWCRGARVPVLLRHIANLMEDRRDPFYGTVQPRLDAYAARFGWAAVIRVVASIATDWAGSGDGPR